MSLPQRIKLSRAKGWKMPANTVKVDRSTPWGNPFIVGKHGTREYCVELHKKLVNQGWLCLSTRNGDEQMAHLRQVAGHLVELRGKNLACWCPLDKPCHADTLLRIANQ